MTLSAANSSPRIGRIRRRNGFNRLFFFSSSSSSLIRPSVKFNSILFKIPSGSHSLSRSSSVRPVSPVMEWQDCTVKMEIDVPVSVAYDCYNDREAIPRWMPFISSVKILEDKPDLSRWSLKYKAFGRNIEFSWLARNMQARILSLLFLYFPRKGAVRFYPKGPSSCIVELTVSYEVPQILTPVASVSILILILVLKLALQPFLESLLRRGLERFATFVKSYK
ncbi:hypothetical protein L484_013853 [Morus notabilis]|uniref:Coenzyme Q-binding protein COQ10 START domain-containing protein n=1 Tax=Morus notabilis TaxID=981085 RepID=W9QN70_9ROSA|nr:hypothetical protein L484_013853 [Morus notabilis]